MEIGKLSFESIIESLHDGLYFVDKDRKIQYWNKAAEKITGFSADEVVGRSCADNILTHVDADGNNLCCGVCPLAHTIQDGAPRDAEVYLHHKDGYRVPVSVRTAIIRDENGAVTGGVELFTDISNRQNYEDKVQKLEKLSYLDALTNLANRPYAEKEIKRCIQEMQEINIPFGILIFDIDFFKAFNEKHGYEVGDKVLQFVANTLNLNARNFDLYARWDGEEFIAIIRNIDRLNLGLVGNRMRMLVDQSYIMHEGEKLHVSVSVGATMAQGYDNIDSLILRADNLRAESRDQGGNRLSLG